MSELKDALCLAERVLDRVNADPDDDLAMLAWQLIRQHETVERLKRDLEDQLDPTLDMIRANRDEILKKHEEAVRRVKACLHRGDVSMALEVLKALDLYHPMNDTWPGWPEGSL